MAKKQTRRSISVSGDTYNAVRDYCDKHGLSASGLVTDLLENYLRDNRDGPPAEEAGGVEPSPPARVEEPQPEVQQQVQTSPPVRVGAPPSLSGSNFPDRRGPGFKALTDPKSLPAWTVTAKLEISRKRLIDAQSSVEVLLHNLMHRRMVNEALVIKVDKKADH